MQKGAKGEWVVGRVNCDFYHPAYVQEELEVLTAVSSISISSLVMEQRIVNASGEVKCIVRTVMVSFDPRTATSVPVTDQWRSDISNFEGRQL